MSRAFVLLLVILSWPAAAQPTPECDRKWADATTEMKKIETATKARMAKSAPLADRCTATREMVEAYAKFQQIIPICEFVTGIDVYAVADGTADEVRRLNSFVSKSCGSVTSASPKNQCVSDFEKGRKAVEDAMAFDSKVADAGGEFANCQSLPVVVEKQSSLLAVLERCKAELPSYEIEKPQGLTRIDIYGKQVDRCRAAAAKGNAVASRVDQKFVWNNYQPKLKYGMKSQHFGNEKAGNNGPLFAAFFGCLDRKWSVWLNPKPDADPKKIFVKLDKHEPIQGRFDKPLYIFNDALSRKVVRALLEADKSVFKLDQRPPGIDVFLGEDGPSNRIVAGGIQGVIERAYPGCAPP